MPDQGLKARVLVNGVPTEVGLTGLLGGVLPTIPVVVDGRPITFAEGLQGAEADRQAVEAARDVVLPARDATTSARDVAVAARDQAVTAATTATAKAGQFVTLAALQAIPAPTVITAAEVTADGANNGGYQYNPANAAAGWVKKSSATVPGLDTLLSLLSPSVLSDLPKIIEAFRAYFGSQSVLRDPYVWAVLDSTNRAALAIDKAGRASVGCKVFGQAEQGISDLADVLSADERGRMALAITLAGAVRLRHMELAGAPNLTYGGFYTDVRRDEAGRVGWALDRLGHFHARLDPISLGASEKAAEIDPALLSGASGNIFDARPVSRVLVRYWSDQMAKASRPFLVLRNRPGTINLLDANAPIRVSIGNGQSNRHGGSEGAGYLNTPREPYASLMFDTGVVLPSAPIAATQDTTFVPLRDTAGRGASIDAAAVMSSQMEAEVAGRRMVPALTFTHGRGGTVWSGLKPGTVYWTAGRVRIQRARDIAASYGKQVLFTDVGITHGEGDRTADYAAIMADIHASYDAENLNGVGGPAVQFFHDQLPAQQTGYYGRATLDQLAVCKANANGRTWLVGPRYPYPFDGTGIHHLPENYAMIGELYAVAKKRVLVDKLPWVPLWHTSIVRTGNLIDVTFAVPFGNLTFDTTFIEQAANYGFSFIDDSSSVSIQSVAITGPTTLRITLTGTPTGANPKLSYAYRGTAISQPHASAWGNLRCSDGPPSQLFPGTKIYFWACSFEENV